MAHTEGPWVACRPGESEWSPHYWEIEDPYGHTATVYGDDDEAAHNAHLISAAPDLLERLRAMVSGMECECDKADPEHPLCDVCWSRLVIAKAEGRSDDQ